MEAGSPRSEGQHGLLQVADFSLHPHMAEETGERPEMSLIRALILLGGPNRLPKPPPPNTITLGIRFSTNESGWKGDTFNL